MLKNNPLQVRIIEHTCEDREPHYTVEFLQGYRWWWRRYGEVVWEEDDCGFGLMGDWSATTKNIEHAQAAKARCISQLTPKQWKREVIE